MLGKWLYADEPVCDSYPSDGKFDPIQAATPNYIDYQVARGYQARFKCNQYARTNRLFVFATLKYDYVDGRLPDETLKRDPGKLMARIRRDHGPTPYLGVAEYGEQFGRFHWHFLLPNSISQDELQAKWLRGTIHYEQLPTYDDLRNVVRYMSEGFFTRNRAFTRRYVQGQGFKPKCKVVEGVTIEEATSLAIRIANERSDTTEVVDWPNDYTRRMVTWNPS